MQSRRQGNKGSSSAETGSPLVTPLTISETRRVHSRSPLSSAATLGRATGKHENMPGNTEKDSEKPRSPTSPLVKPRIEANRIIMHSSNDRCSNCSESILQIKSKDREVRACSLV